MSKQFKSVAIIGAGASGLLCAILCAKAKLKVTLFEQNSKCGKKILVSGNGKCNISNTNATYKNYHSENKNFVKYALSQFGFKEFNSFVNKIGLLLTTKECNKAYPISFEAKNVVSVLVKYATNLGVNISLEHKISKIKPLFETNKYDFVIIATGSNAASHLGGCEDGYKFAKEFNHTIKKTYASLVQLHSPNKIVKNLAGTKIYANTTLMIDNKMAQKISGDVLFTNYGLSGLNILDISTLASLALKNKQKVEVHIDVLPSYSAQEIQNHIMNIAILNKKFVCLDILYGLLPNKLANGVMDFLGIEKIFIPLDVDHKAIQQIAQTLKKWKFVINDTHGFRHCEVSGGGVDTSEVCDKTMQSFKKENLYFCGEVLDVVGQRGGYNFAFAWGSAYLASKDIISKANL